MPNHMYKDVIKTQKPLLLSIDPSIVSLGWALHHGVDKDMEFLRAGAISQKTHTDYYFRGAAACYTLRHLISSTVEKGQEVWVVIECPANWFSEKGIQSKDNEAVQKVYACVGALVSGLVFHPDVSQIYTVSPSGWKGNAQKQHMIRRWERLRRIKGIHIREEKGSVPHDTIEAIMLARAAGDVYDALTHRFDYAFKLIWNRVYAYEWPKNKHWIVSSKLED